MRELLRCAHEQTLRTEELLRTVQGWLAGSGAPPCPAGGAPDRLLRGHLTLEGPQELLIPQLEQLGRSAALTLHLDASALMPADAWEQVPLNLLTTAELAIIREDLRLTKRGPMADQLHLSPRTITAYRTTIRRKLLTIPAEQRPLWALAWLRRFPGMPRSKNGEPKNRGAGKAGRFVRRAGA
ncbi:MAG TPA: hypothetical protein VFS21_12050 [Roseiflexaceae bacterium]|nr:hypothetical protein [Roseiflexaceae bacterium]